MPETRKAHVGEPSRLRETDTSNGNTPVIVSAVRTPLGRRNGALSGIKAVTLLGHVLRAAIEQAGLEPAQVEQVIGGCVTQAGEQSLNVTRNAWLNTGWDPLVACSTVDMSCGSAQQANHVIWALIASGVIDIGIACGVESMSRVPMGINLYNGPGHYKTSDYRWDDPPKAQFGGSERIATRAGITRQAADRFGVLSQQRAAKAWADGRFDREIVPINVALEDGTMRRMSRDEGLRDTSEEGLAALKPNVDGGVHTPGSTSQVCDGAAAIVWMSQRRARELGCTPRARLAGQAITGSDPYYLLDGPVVATSKILATTGRRLEDIDLMEVNEAFAAVVLNWMQEYDADPERVNVNGGAIALGHPLGASGTRLLVTALHELERRDEQTALVTMCCGGALGTASLLERF